jgi:hypothetical protein
MFMKAIQVGTMSALLFLAATEACRAQDAEKEAARRMLTPLVKVDDFPMSQREAAKAVAASIQASKENPKEFFVRVDAKEDGRLLVFHLWHASAFAPENRGVKGNPGGKCRDVEYDTKQNKVTQTRAWR